MEAQGGSVGAGGVGSTQVDPWQATLALWH